MSERPLSVLLSRVLGMLTDQIESAARVETGVAPRLAVWSNVLRCVDEAGPEGLSERDLPAAARISSRLATAAVTAAAHRGWVDADVSEGAKRRRMTLTDRGRKAVEIWRERLAALDEEWTDTPLRGTLEELVARLPFELPHFPATYGSADPSAIGGPYVQNNRKQDGLPAHGNDWKPVHRGDGDTVSTLSVTALLSQALVAFTIDYEDRFPWPLANTINVLSQLGTEPRPLADIQGSHGIAGNGKSLVERHLIAAVTKDPADPKRKLVALTDRGRLVMQHHPERIRKVDAEWRERFGDASIASLRDAMERAAKAAPADLSDHVDAPLDAR